jgi:hypothetical protein
MTGSITYLAGREHTNDLLRAAAAERYQIPERPSRWTRLARARFYLRRAPQTATVAT